MEQCLGHQYLISLLLPLLLRTSTSHPGSPSRVIVLSSAGHSSAPSCGVDYRSVVRDTSIANGQGREGELSVRGRFERTWLEEYGQSKWGDVALSRWLHWMYGPEGGRRKRMIQGERVGEGEIISVSIHPGIPPLLAICNRS